jgi:hypothetical protein
MVRRPTMDGIPGTMSPHSTMARHRMVMDCRLATVRHRSTALRRAMRPRHTAIGCRRAMAPVLGTVDPRPIMDDRRTFTGRPPPMAGGPGTARHPVMDDRSRMLISRRSTTVHAATTGRRRACTSRRRPGCHTGSRARTPGVQYSQQLTYYDAINALRQGRSAVAPRLQGSGAPPRRPRATGWFQRRS